MSSDASVINVSLSNLARQRYSQDEPLSDDQKIYLETKVKPKEIVIIIFMMLLWLFSIRRFFKIWSNILNYSTPTESITRTNTAAEGVETFVVWAMTSLRRKASFAHQPMQAPRNSIRRSKK